MSNRVRIHTLRLNTDARGSVFEPLEISELPHQRNCHVVITGPGGIRGNHYHPRGEEALTIAGPALVRCRDGDEVIDTEVPEGMVMRFDIPAGVAHAVKNTGTAPMLLIGFNTVAFHPDEPNTVRAVILES